MGRFSYVVGSGDLRHHHRVKRIRTGYRFEVEAGQARLYPVDADDDRLTGRAQLPDHRPQTRARPLPGLLRDAILEVEDQRVGAEPGRLAHHVFAVGGNKQRGTNRPGPSLDFLAAPGLDVFIGRDCP